jgi:uncharacterized protein (TIGR00375 family)
MLKTKPSPKRGGFFIMRFIADLHIHSRYSRATSPSLSFEELYRFARIKGVTLVGTGDCTHPAWLAEVEEKLESCGTGLYALKQEHMPLCDGVPSGDVRFMLTGEISTIYKAAGATRKVHHIVCLPNLESARRFSQSLGRIGNVVSDGRPILGLDSRDLLAMLLDASADAVLIPAHIWTPWFSVLGAKSGFDRIEDCYRDLSDHIFALETGLSSDPAMNWMVSSLDRYTLVSNSDLHSARKLAREANVFDCELSYAAVMAALKEPSKGFLGTIEFFPEEGKYHFDGHRDCRVSLTPAQAVAAKGICPACGKALTPGVMSRVMQLADRAYGEKKPNALPFWSLVGLDDIIAEILQVGVASKKVQAEYFRCIAALGRETDILMQLPCDMIAKAASPRIAQGVQRVREGKVTAVSGYDGAYGVISVFPLQGADE